ncbi:MAG: MTH938/NDUFAF3 family protein [Rhizobiaceae bacterium]
MSETEKSAGAGLSLVPAHFPGRAPVDTYGNGGFRFAEMSHKGSILCLPSGIYGWTAKQASDLTLINFKRVFAEIDLELILIGTGNDPAPISQALRDEFKKLDIRVDAMTTGAAARTFNVLLSEGRAVGAALLAVD